MLSLLKAHRREETLTFLMKSMNFLQLHPLSLAPQTHLQVLFASASVNSSHHHFIHITKAHHVNLPTISSKLKAAPTENKEGKERSAGYVRIGTQDGRAVYAVCSMDEPCFLVHQEEKIKTERENYWQSLQP